MTRIPSQTEWNRRKHKTRGRRTSYRPPSKRKQRGDWWHSIFGVLVIGAVIFGTLSFMAAERFPEYFDRVVVMTSTGSVVGPVTRVRDGDTIEVAGVPIRFGSLDCAERGTVAGQQATARMRSLISDQTLVCYLNGRASYDRKIGSCKLSDGRDLAGVMIAEGYCERFW